MEGLGSLKQPEGEKTGPGPLAFFPCQTSLQDSSAVISCREAREPDVCLFQ